MGPGRVEVTQEGTIPLLSLGHIFCFGRIVSLRIYDVYNGGLDGDLRVPVGVRWT
jgi:hypothetical protein